MSNKKFIPYCRSLADDIIRFMAPRADKLWWSMQRHFGHTRGAFGGTFSHAQRGQCRRRGGYALKWWERDGYESRIHGLADRCPQMLISALFDGTHEYHKEALEARDLQLI